MIRPGLTLLEVVVGLVLMGSLLSATLLAFSKHQRQLALANKRIEAVNVAESLIHELSNSRGGFPIRGRGTIPGHPTWNWETMPAGQTVLVTVPLQLVRFSIIEVRESPVRLVSVDVFRPGDSP